MKKNIDKKIHSVVEMASLKFIRLVAFVRGVVNKAGACSRLTGNEVFGSSTC